MKITKREAILLVLLLIFAVLFAEYQLVVTPGMERYQELESRNDELAAQIDAINLDLLIAEQRKEQRDQTLQEISQYHERFLGELQPSVLLHYTYDLMTRNEFVPSAYTISPVIDAIPFVESVADQDISYALAELVAEYNRLRGVNGDEAADPAAEDRDQEAVSEDEAESDIASLELNEFLISGTGTYEQIKALLDDIKQQDKSIVVSLFDLYASENDTIDFSMRIQYFGVKKFDPVTDQYSTWPRPGFDGGAESPFASIISVDDEELTEETDIVEEEQIETEQAE